MRTAKTTILLLALVAALAAPSAAQALPPTFFGIAPQTPLTDTDAPYMKAGRIGSVRWPVNWATVQPTAKGGYDWSSVDPAVEAAARHGLTVLPFLYGTPRWAANKPTTLPVSGRARKAWLAFVRRPFSATGPEANSGMNTRRPWLGSTTCRRSRTRSPIRNWQVWNEANFFYFAYPVSPGRYARLLKPTYGAIKAADPSAKVILSGLFGNPDESGKRGMDAAKFLEALYRVPGIKATSMRRPAPIRLPRRRCSKN